MKPKSSDGTTRHFCETCYVWHEGLWCPHPLVPEVRLLPGWLDRDFQRALEKQNGK